LYDRNEVKENVVFPKTYTMWPQSTTNMNWQKNNEHKFGRIQFLECCIFQKSTVSDFF